MSPTSPPEPVALRPRPGRGATIMVGLAAALVGLGLVHLILGSVYIPPGEVLRILLGGAATKDTWQTIVLDYRLPRVLAATLGGAALGVAGLQMQTMFRNPLAGPYVLGIDAGASLGVALVVLGAGVFGGQALLVGLGFLGNLSLVAAAFIGAAAVMLVVLLVARRVENTMTLLLLGLMFGYATGALVSLLFFFSMAEGIHAFVAWSFGSFAGVDWGQMAVFAPSVALGLVLALALVKPLNALLLGEAYARSMGLTVGRARVAIIISTAVLSGAVTAFCGPIAFIGLAVPHLCRGLFNTSDHRILVPATILVGAITTVAADLVAQLPGSQLSLPLNAVTSLFGAPAVVWIILRQQSLKASFAS